MQLRVFDQENSMIIKNPTPEQVENGLRMLNGITCSEVQIKVHDAMLHIVGNNERVRITYDGRIPNVTFLTDDNQLEGAIYPTLINGEVDMIPFGETIGIDKAVEVCHYFIANEGKLPDEFMYRE